MIYLSTELIAKDGYLEYSFSLNVEKKKVLMSACT
jgi:hypothetical protein